MALIDDLLNRIVEPALRQELLRAVDDLRKTQRFGLVFENHVPETAELPDLSPTEGALVRRHDRQGDDTLYRLAVNDGTNATVIAVADGRRHEVPAKDLCVVKRFGDPIYPSLEPIGGINEGARRPHHGVINGENFHALQLLVYLFEGEVDCIYIDPPFNSGARDWKYNNRYVDKNDTWRHSKWLSFMQKRLALAKRLLKPDGVLVCAIDDNEHAHLCALLEQEFRAYDITSVAIVHNPRGIQGDNFSFTNEFAVFVVPEKQKIIADRIIPVSERDTRDLRDNGGESLRTDARNCFYPIIVRGDQVVGFGPVPDNGFHPAAASVTIGDGSTAIWPIDRNGIERKWRYARQSVESISTLLSVAYPRGATPSAGVPQIKITKDTGKYRTVWTGSRYDSNAYGTKLVSAITGTTFPFPKSVFNVKDVLVACTGNKPEALILDFFAGSGTTLHATCMLNDDDGGRRRAILVTNNAVADREAKALRKRGFYPGDAEYERQGIFESVTLPRCKGVVTGLSAEGRKLDGDLDGRPLGRPYDASVDFFRLRYLDPDQIDLGTQYSAILPSLWLAAGGVGPRDIDAKSTYEMPVGSTFAVLIDERHFEQFRLALVKRPDIRKAWLVTDSEESYTEMRAAMPTHLYVSMLYRDYLRNFAINTRLVL